MPGAGRAPRGPACRVNHIPSPPEHGPAFRLIRRVARPLLRAGAAGGAGWRGIAGLDAFDAHRVAGGDQLRRRPDARAGLGRDVAARPAPHGVGRGGRRLAAGGVSNDVLPAAVRAVPPPRRGGRQPVGAMRAHALAGRAFGAPVELGRGGIGPLGAFGVRRVGLAAASWTVPPSMLTAMPSARQVATVWRARVRMRLKVWREMLIRRAASAWGSESRSASRRASSWSRGRMRSSRSRSGMPAGLKNTTLGSVAIRRGQHGRAMREPCTHAAIHRKPHAGRCSRGGIAGHP